MYIGYLKSLLHKDEKEANNSTAQNEVPNSLPTPKYAHSQPEYTAGPGLTYLKLES